MKSAVKLAKEKLAERQSQIASTQKRTKEVDRTRVNRILNISEMIENYTYDAKNIQSLEITFKLDAMKPRLDLYSIIQKDAKVSFIAKVAGIRRCFLNQSTLPEDKGCFKLITEGINVNVSRYYTEIYLYIWQVV